MPRELEPSDGPQAGREAACGQESRPASRRPGAPSRGWQVARAALRVAIHVFGILVVLVLAGGGYLAWRLAQGPVELDFLTPRIEAALSSEDRGIAVEIGGTQLGYDRDEGAIDIVARDVRLFTADHQLVAAVPEVALSLDLRLALRGTVAPRVVLVREPSFRLRRETDGSWRIGIRGGGGGEDTDVTERIANLLQPPSDDRALGVLRRIVVRGATLEVDDRMLGISWSARRGAATLFRTPKGFKGDATFAAALGGRESELRLDYSYSWIDKKLEADLNFADLEPNRIAALSPELRPLDALRAPVSGLFRIAATLQPLRIEGARVELAVGAGTIAHPELPSGVVAIRGGALKADYDPPARRIHLLDVSLDLYGPMLGVSGAIDGLDVQKLLFGGEGPAVATGMTVAAEVAARAVPVGSLDALWPTALAHGARAWVVENIRDGTAEEAHVALQVSAPALVGPFAVDRLDGTLAYRDLTVYYRRPLPPVRGVKGSARFDRSRFELTPTSGSLLGLRITGGKVSLTGLDIDKEHAAIDVRVAGPIRDVLTVIDTKPFEYAKEIGIEPARTSGNAEMQLGFAFPLVKDLKFDQVELAVKAQVTDAAIRNFLFKSDLTDGAFELGLDRAGVRLNGGAKLGGVPAAASVTHVFGKPKDNVRTRATVWANLDREGRVRLGLDLLPDTLDGPVGVDASYAGLADKRANVTATLDLKDATLTEKLVNYEKPPGILGAARLELELRDDKLTRIRDLIVKSAGLDVRGSVAFAEQTPDVERIELKRLIAGETDLAGLATRNPDGAWRIEFSGLSYDASALLKDATSSASNEAPPLSIDAKFQRLIAGPKREARNVTLQLASDRLHWQMARLDADLAGGGKMSLRFGQAGGARPFSFTSNNFGAVVQLLDLTDSIADGSVEVKGEAIDAGAQRTFRGHLEARDYRLIRAPAFAKLLSLASLTSFASLLAGEGLPFSRLSGDFVFADGKLVLDNVHAYGGALGINTSGTVDLANGTLDLDGTLVPAYTINSVLGYVPILGKLLLGGEGQGLFAANFHAVGPIDDPKISVNPLSALAPGFLRKLFLFDAGNPNASPTSQPLQQQDR
jgi:hypothetical protein